MSHIRDVENRNAIADIVQSYKPEKIREVGVKMSIILKNDIPVYQRPRRLSLAEKQKVNAHK